MSADKIWMSKAEFDDIMDYMERLKETVEVLSNSEIVKKINGALKRIESGEYLTKDDLVFD